MLGPAIRAKDIRRHGELVPLGGLLRILTHASLTHEEIVDESQPVKLIMQALPGIEQFVSHQLE